jgi:DNA-binding MarR family transcriptional regulator
MQQSDEFVTTLIRWNEALMRVSMQNFLRYSKEVGLSMPQIGALFQIQHRGIIGVGDMGSELGITSAAASQMLDRLVQQGLVIRSEDPNDRRGKQIKLTEKGLTVMHDSVRARQSWIDELSSRLSPTEKESIIAALSIVIDQTNQLEQGDSTLTDRFHLNH